MMNIIGYSYVSFFFSAEDSLIISGFPQYWAHSHGNAGKSCSSWEKLLFQYAFNMVLKINTKALKRAS